MATRSERRRRAIGQSSARRAARRGPPALDASSLDAAIAEADRAAERAAAVVRVAAGAVRNRVTAFERDAAAETAAFAADARARADLAAEYDRIRAMRAVGSVRVTWDVIEVTTRNLEIVEDGVRYDVGRYRIRIPRDAGAARGVTILALHGRRSDSGAPHPHIDTYGGVDDVPCWGNIEAPLTRALQRCEFDVAMQLVLAMLESGTPPGHDPNLYRERLRAIGRPITRSRRTPRRRSTHAPGT